MANVTHRRPDLHVADWTIGLLVAYLVLAGGTSVAETYTLPRLFNGLIGIALIAAYLFSLPRSFDRVDLLSLGALLLFLGACAMSTFPRQSLDSALAAFAYAAAFHLARRRLRHGADRRHLIQTLCALSLVVAVAAAAGWVGTALEYRALTGRTPPLDLKYATAPWGHRHDVALLLVLLAPAWFAAPMNRLRAALAFPALAATATVVFLGGSRTVWLALAVGLAFVALPPIWRAIRDRRRRSHAPVWLAFGSMFALLVLAAVVGGPALARRVTDGGTLAARGELWGAAIQVWSEHPLFGLGPGTFAWALQTTPYFEVSSWAPRHPDNTFFRLLAEGGGFGIAAGMIVVAAVGWSVVRYAAPSASVFALVAVIVATIGAEPTEFGFLVAVSLAWAAYGAPNHSEPRRSSLRRARPALIVNWIALCIPLLALAVVTVGSAAHDSAARLTAAGRLDEAVSALDQAIAYDPGMALYWRERGVLRLANGQIEAARSDLERAYELNRSDDVVLRALALAAVRTDGFVEARIWADKALKAQRADVLNQLLAARVYRLSGDRSAATMMLAEVVQGFPWIIATPGWPREVPPGVTNEDLLSLAITNWQRGEYPPGPFDTQAVWLTALANRQELAPQAAARTAGPQSIAPAIAALARCDVAAAAEAIGKATEAERAQPVYWSLRAGIAMLAGSDSDPHLRIYAMTAGDPFPRGSTPAVDVLDETRTLGLTLDHWGYNRLPIRLPSAGPAVPNPDYGLERWLYNPIAAAQASRIQPVILRCLDQ